MAPGSQGAAAVGCTPAPHAPYTAPRRTLTVVPRPLPVMRLRLGGLLAAGGGGGGGAAGEPGGPGLGVAAPVRQEPPVEQVTCSKAGAGEAGGSRQGGEVPGVSMARLPPSVVRTVPLQGPSQHHAAAGWAVSCCEAGQELVAAALRPSTQGEAWAQRGAHLVRAQHLPRWAAGVDDQGALGAGGQAGAVGGREVQRVRARDGAGDVAGQQDGHGAAAGSWREPADRAGQSMPV